MAKRRDGSTIARTKAHFKKVLYQTSEEADSWKLNAYPPELLQMEAPPYEVQLPEVDEANPFGGTAPSADCSVEPPPPPPPQEASRCSTRPRRSVGEYLRTKYPDHVLPKKIQCMNSCRYD